ncbi:hypothetical protein J6590_067646 [Homalodisca vitripennis]|nr:hypothetical protein J6590_067646 [Homalodisca vitripennis]
MKEVEAVSSEVAVKPVPRRARSRRTRYPWWPGFHRQNALTYDFITGEMPSREISLKKLSKKIGKAPSEWDVPENPLFYICNFSINTFPVPTTARLGLSWSKIVNLHYSSSPLSVKPALLF